MQISLYEAQFYASRLVWVGLPLSLAAGIGALVLLNFYIRKCVNKLASQKRNIAGKIFHLLSANNHRSKYCCPRRNLRPDHQSCNGFPVVKKVLPVVKTPIGG